MACMFHNEGNLKSGLGSLVVSKINKKTAKDNDARKVPAAEKRPVKIKKKRTVILNEGFPTERTTGLGRF